MYLQMSARKCFNAGDSPINNDFRGSGGWMRGGSVNLLLEQHIEGVSAVHFFAEQCRHMTVMVPMLTMGSSS